MKTVYIQFEAPKVIIGKEKQGFSNRLFSNLITNILTKVIPKANPDFEDKIDAVKHWFVECESETGIPQREIGFDEQGRSIVKMPFRKNYGYWTDNNLQLEEFREDFEVSEIPKEVFEQQWNLFNDNLSM